MNLLGPTLVMYLLVGVGVAVALYLSDIARRPSEQWFALATAIPFWPLYLPLVLARPRIAEGNWPSQREHRLKMR